MAISAEIQGTVVLRIVLDANGAPTTIAVLAPVPMLDQAALESASEWRYEPTVVDGVARRVVVIEAVRFLNESVRVGDWSDLAGTTSYNRAVRIYAAKRIGARSGGMSVDAAGDLLRRLATDADPEVAAEARAAIARLQSPAPTP